MAVKIHVNQHIIRANKIRGESNPPLTIIRGRKRERGNAIQIVGNARVVYSPDKPLSCGARVWIEADDARVEEPVSKILETADAGEACEINV